MTDEIKETVNENEEVNQEQQAQADAGWKDVKVSLDLPLGALIQFFNILNQRICSLEDITTIQGPDGKAISLTDYYAAQAKKQEEEEEQARQAQEKEDK